jgi:hypothetical protein
LNRSKDLEKFKWQETRKIVNHEFHIIFISISGLKLQELMKLFTKTLICMQRLINAINQDANFTDNESNSSKTIELTNVVIVFSAYKPEIEHCHRFN